MHFVRRGNQYRVVRITGPSHNLLSVELSSHKHGEVILEALQVLEKTANKGVLLIGEEVKRFVLEGVSEANNTYSTHYQVTKIQYVPSDTPPTTIYRMLAQKIIERIATGKFE